MARVFFFCGVFQARWQESVGRFGDRTFTIFERRRLSFQVENASRKGELAGILFGHVQNPLIKSFLLYRDATFV